jgi:hypothetical protein
MRYQLLRSHGDNRSIAAGTPVVVRDEKSGLREIVWAPGDDD